MSLLQTIYFYFLPQTFSDVLKRPNRFHGNDLFLGFPPHMRICLSETDSLDIFLMAFHLDELFILYLHFYVIFFLLYLYFNVDFLKKK